MSSTNQKNVLGSLSTRTRVRDSPRTCTGTDTESRTGQGQNIHEAPKYRSVSYQKDETNLLSHDLLAVCYSPQQARTPASPPIGLHDYMVGQTRGGHGPGSDQFGGLNMKNQAIRGSEPEWIAEQGSSMEIMIQSPQDSTDASDVMRGANNPQFVGLPRGCSYHGPIIRMESRNIVQQDGVSPMGRFLQEGAFDQSALVLRADTGRISIARECSCYMDGEWYTTGDEK